MIGRNGSIHISSGLLMIGKYNASACFDDAGLSLSEEAPSILSSTIFSGLKEPSGKASAR